MPLPIPVSTQSRSQSSHLKMTPNRFFIFPTGALEWTAVPSFTCLRSEGGSNIESIAIALRFAQCGTSMARQFAKEALPHCARSLGSKYVMELDPMLPIKKLAVAAFPTKCNVVLIDLLTIY